MADEKKYEEKVRVQTQIARNGGGAPGVAATNEFPHFGQNRAASGTFVPHCGQIMTDPSRRSLARDPSRPADRGPRARPLHGR